METSGVSGGSERSESGRGSHKELSRSLDCLDIDSMSDSSSNLVVQKRRKSQTLPNFPPPDLREVKKLSLGSAFGTKHLGLGRKFSSLLTAPSERYPLSLTLDVSVTLHSIVAYSKLIQSDTQEYH